MGIKVLAVVALVAVAQVFPSCGGSEGPPRIDVIGTVEAKFTSNQETLPNRIVIRGLDYGVPYEFYLEVRVGDLVRYQGGVWTIMRRAGP